MSGSAKMFDLPLEAVVRNFRDVAYGVHRATYRPFLPAIDARATAIVEALKAEGTAVTSLGDLGSSGLLEVAQKLFAEMPRVERAGSKSYILSAPRELVEQHPALIEWGLSDRIIGIVENYIGVPVSYRGLQARIDLADGTQLETRRWHRDAEDRRIVKFIVYVSDVPPDEGAYEYIPRAKTPPLRAIRYTDGRVLDGDMASLVPQKYWLPCTGRPGTVVVTDTCSVWHRGGVPGHRDRLTLFYAYNSRRPLAPQHCEPLFDRDGFISKLNGRLSRAQIAAIS
jgi:hypothetical protein